jgi:hypothetical protein
MHDVDAIEGDAFPMPEIDANGVDRSQIRRSLALTPAQRLQVLESALASMIKVRSATHRTPVLPDSDQTS